MRVLYGLGCIVTPVSKYTVVSRCVEHLRCMYLVVDLKVVPKEDVFKVMNMLKNMNIIYLSLYKFETPSCYTNMEYMYIVI